MPVESVNGINLNYEDTGAGEPVVLVMGTGASGRAWHLYQVPALVSAGYRVITFDNRGIPPTDECAQGFTIDDLVADTAALVEHLGLGPCRFAGVSMGAQVVQELMLVRPDLVRQGILMATRGRSDAMRAAMAVAERALRDAGALPPPEYDAVVRAVQNLSPRTLNDDERVRDWLDLFEMAPSCRAPGVRAQVELDGFPSRLEAYRRISVPTLVIGFGDDLMLPPHLNREVADAIPGARYEQIDDCGHYGYLERPEEVNTAMLKFFAQ
ncbi:MAG: alpha/beta fold hydrolase [Sciscionella sp.]